MGPAWLVDLAMGIFFFVRDAQGNVLCVLVIGAQCQKAEHNAVVNRCMIIFLFIG